MGCAHLPTYFLSGTGTDCVCAPNTFWLNFSSCKPDISIIPKTHPEENTSSTKPAFPEFHLSFGVHIQKNYPKQSVHHPAMPFISSGSPIKTYVKHHICHLRPV